MGAPTPEELRLLEKWEDLRAVKNLMGRYVLDILNNRERSVIARHWSRRDDISFGVNTGWYAGRDQVSAMYEAFAALAEVKTELLRAAFPDRLSGKTAEELFGAGMHYNLPNSTPVIEIAGDGRTAKGIWYCHGSYADLFPSGVQSRWTWGYYTADLIKEDGQWKLWHLNWLNDADTLCGQTWVRENVPYPDEPRFAALHAERLPRPNVPAELWQLYSPRRRFMGTPRIPQPYERFEDTFSYGAEGGAS